MCHRGAK
ncbi:hypothetical protein GN244_ATG10172 [Phytophthora infestans]|nr:hypothetical protein GN244_ATG10172 [Phytophthora infestans]KAF4143225.1 hypothetical protein GN958_ATG07586 [Phytophthora infestans]